MGGDPGGEGGIHPPGKLMGDTDKAAFETVKGEVSREDSVKFFTRQIKSVVMSGDPGGGERGNTSPKKLMRGYNVVSFIIYFRTLSVA